MKILTFLPMRIFNYSKSSREFWLFEPKPAGSLDDGLPYVCVPLTTGFDINPFGKRKSAKSIESELRDFYKMQTKMAEILCNPLHHRNMNFRI
jgi:hypothetical protein